MATQSVPADWYEDVRMLITLTDVLRVQAEEAKRKG